MAKVYDIAKLKKFLGEYLELKGIDTTKLMRCFSVEHEDKNPSMGYYEVANICKCFACGEKYDIFKLVGEEYNLDTFKERLKKVDELYNNRELIKNINETIYSKKNTYVELSYGSSPKEQSIKVRTYQIKRYEEYIKKCMSNLKDCDYLTKRGISKEVQEKYHIGYDKDFKKGEWKAIIIPISYGSFTARNTDVSSKDKIRKVGIEKIFNFWELGEKENFDKTFYIVEGEIDALSLIEIGRKAIGLGSIAYIDIFIEKLKDNIPQNKFYLMLDNDERGRKVQKELAFKLRKLGINCISSNILGKYKDPNEYLIKDRKDFINSLNSLENNKWLHKENILNITD